MANGRTHAGDSALLTAPVTISISLHSGVLPGALAGLGCFLGIVLSPDLDQESWTYSEWVLRKVPVVGWILSWLMFIYWYPYSKAFRHGNWMTHVPVISTVLRLAYALSVPLLVMALWDVELLVEIFPTLQYMLGYVFIGLCVSDTAHWIRDGFRVWT